MSDTWHRPRHTCPTPGTDPAIHVRHLALTPPYMSDTWHRPRHSCPTPSTDPAIHVRHRWPQTHHDACPTPGTEPTMSDTAARSKLRGSRVTLTYSTHLPACPSDTTWHFSPGEGLTRCGVSDAAGAQALLSISSRSARKRGILIRAVQEGAVSAPQALALNTAWPATQAGAEGCRAESVYDTYRARRRHCGAPEEWLSLTTCCVTCVRGRITQHECIRVAAGGWHMGVGDARSPAVIIDEGKTGGGKRQQPPLGTLPLARSPKSPCYPIIT
eukprot:1195793-Prorocentrum_minimum.AAC.6